MKTKEEIEQLANEEYKDKLHNPFFTAAPMGYIKGYTQCQEDMAVEIAELKIICQEYSKDVKALNDMLSLNKQD